MSLEDRIFLLDMLTFVASGFWLAWMVWIIIKDGEE